MEIYSLRMMVTEADVNQAVEQAIKEKAPVRQLQVRLTGEGVRVKGVYSMLVGVPFETTWTVGVQQGRVTARLAAVKVVGLGAGMLNTMLMSALGKFAAKEPAVSVQGDTVVVDLDRLLTERGIAGRTNVTAIRTEEGRLWIECGDPVPV